MTYTLAPSDLERLVLKIESSYVLVKAVAAALADHPFEIASLYPPGSSLVLPVFNRLPARVRDHLVQFGVTALGKTLNSLPAISSEDIAHWCVSHYPPRPYPAIIIGAANGAAAQLAAFLDAPLLATHLVIGLKNTRVTGVRQRDISVVEREIAIGYEFVRRVIAAGSGLDAILHYDSYHDRFLVNAMTLVRLKMNRIPVAYSEFIS
ncbi:MAG: hypothetical protein ACREDG_03045, partial [Methylocella sp.]